MKRHVVLLTESLLQRAFYSILIFIPGTIIHVPIGRLGKQWDLIEVYSMYGIKKNF